MYWIDLHIKTKTQMFDTITMSKTYNIGERTTPSDSIEFSRHIYKSLCKSEDDFTYLLLFVNIIITYWYCFFNNFTIFYKKLKLIFRFQHKNEQKTRIL